MPGEIKWAVVGIVVAAPTALLAYLEGPVANAGLAAWAALVAVAGFAFLDRQLSALRRSASRTTGELGRMREENGQLRASLKELKAENAALGKQLAQARNALDDKIGLAVQRLKEWVRAEVQGLAAAVRDSEVETGLAALNRYTALATHPAILLGDEDPTPGTVE